MIKIQNYNTQGILMIISPYSLIFFFVAILLSACNKEIGTYSGEGQDIQPNTSQQNNTNAPTAPTAPSVATETNEDTAKTITLNGTDTDGNTLRYIKVTNPTHGVISISDNIVTYTPTENYNGNDSFTYKINDGTQDSNIATVSITVLAVNDTPTANAGDNQTGLEGKRFNLSGSGTDLENDTLTYSWQQTDNSGVTAQLSNPQSATPSLTAPEVNAATTLRFTVTVDDGNGGSATDTVDVLVNNLTINDSALRRCFGTPFPSGVELYQLTSFSCHDVDLSSADLAEFGKLPSLTRLSLSKNSLSDISALANMNKLTTLAVFENKISDLRPFSNTNNLRYLELASNEISDISTLSGISNLEKLGLGNNQISDISALSDIKNLTTLALNNNQISDISVLLTMTKLTTLVLNTNRISNPLPLTDLTELTYLDLANNQIDDLSFLSNLAKLTSLNLSNNDSDPIEGTMLSDISLLSNLTTLTNLNLSNNNISDILSLSNLTTLTHLELSNNNIGDINSLSNLTKLTYLRLSKANIIDVSPLSKMTELTYIDLFDNKIEQIDNSSTTLKPSFFSKMNQLDILRLGKNKLISIDSISLMTNEFDLYIQGNCIQNFDKFPSENGNINVIGKGSQAPLSSCEFSDL